MTPELRQAHYRHRVTDRMLLIELMYDDGRRIDELILTHIEEDEGQLKGLAERWRISPSTIRRWIDQLGLGFEVALIRERYGLRSGNFPLPTEGPLVRIAKDYAEGEV